MYLCLKDGNLNVSQETKVYRDQTHHLVSWINLEGRHASSNTFALDDFSSIWMKGRLAVPKSPGTCSSCPKPSKWDSWTLPFLTLLCSVQRSGEVVHFRWADFQKCQLWMNCLPVKWQNSSAGLLPTMGFCVSINWKKMSSFFQTF